MTQEQDLQLLPSSSDGAGTPAPTIPPTAQSPADSLSNSDTSDSISGGASVFDQMMAKKSPFMSSKFVQDLAKGTNEAAKSSPAVAAAPGGWARTVLAGAMHALGGGMDSLGDAAAAGEAAGEAAPGGGGALTGIARTLQARGQRQRQEREEVSKEKTQEALRAETMQRIAANQRNTYRQDQETRTASYAQNAKYMETLRKDYDTQEDKDNVTQDQLNELMKNKDFWKTHTGRPVGEEPVYDGNGKPKIDKDGHPVMSPLYSISNIHGMTERKHVLSEQESKYIKNNGGDNLPTGTALGLHEFDNTMARSDAAREAVKRIEKANDEDMSEEKNRQLATELRDMNIQHYISMTPSDPLAGLHTAQKNAQAHISAIDQYIDAVQKKDPNNSQNPVMQKLQAQRQQFVDQAQKIDHVISFGFTDAAKENYSKRQDEQVKQAEVERHDRADEANKAAEIKAKKGGFSGDPNATSPQAFLNSLDPEARSLVTLIGTGKAPLTNPGYLIARKPEILEAVSKAFPDFDVSKVAGYQNTYKNFTSGKTSVEIKSGGTALKHLKEAQQLNTAASHIPGTPAHNAYENKIDTLATELAKFYGDATVPAIAAIKKTLMATLPGNREAAIRTQAQSMGDRLESMETEWNNAAPSKAYQAPMPGISLEAKQARAVLDSNYAAAHPELGIKSEQKTENTNDQSWGSQFGAVPRGQ